MFGFKKRKLQRELTIQRLETIMQMVDSLYTCGIDGIKMNEKNSKNKK